LKSDIALIDSVYVLVYKKFLYTEQRFTGSRFQDSNPAGFRTFLTNRIGSGCGFIQIPDQDQDLNFIVFGFDAKTIIIRIFANI